MLVGVGDGSAAKVAHGLPTLASHLVAPFLFVEPEIKSWATNVWIKIASRLFKGQVY